MFSQMMNATCLALEANQVIWMRMTQLHGLEPVLAAQEMGLMVSEKTQAAHAAMASLASGQSSDDVVSAYRDIVQANIKRLSL